MFIFLAIASLIFGSAHYYVFVRLSDYLQLSPDTRTIILTITAVLCFSLVISLPLMRMVSKKAASVIAWMVFSWMGVLMFLVISIFTSDMILLLINIAILLGLQLHTDTSQIKYFLGYAVIISTIALTCISIWTALLSITVKSLSITINRLPKELEGLRIVQITDVHIGPTISGKKMLHIVERVNELNPDIIAITGDLVDGSVLELQEHVSHLKDLRAKYGVYFVTGNHEYYSGVNEWVHYLRSLGIVVLRNELVTITNETGQAIDLAGVDDYHGNEDIAKALANHNPDNPLILLAHQPASVVEASEYNVDLQLSGHTHGGQIWPWNYAVLLQQPYVKGLHRHKNTKTQIYISSGTGYWGPPMRLGTKAEITNITLLSDMGSDSI